MSNNIREIIGLVEIGEFSTGRIRKKLFWEVVMKIFHGGIKIEEETIKMVEQKDEVAQKSQKSWRKIQEAFFPLPFGEYIQVVCPRGSSVFATMWHFSVGWI